MPKLLRRSRSWATSSTGIVIVLSLMATPAAATEPTTQSYTLDGQAGMWFPMPKARKLLEDVTQLPLIKLQLEKTEQRLTLEQTRTSLLERNVATMERIAVTWKATAETQAGLLTNKNPWWKSPYLWLAVGVVAGSAATIGLAIAVKKGVN